MGRYYITDWKWRPYAVFGLGSTKHTSIFDKDNNISSNIGIGLQSKLAKHWSGRAQLLWRHDKDGDSLPQNNGYGDFYFSIGLNFDFGGTDPAPPPPPPPPAPPPKPVNPDLDGDGVPNERDKCPNTRPGAVVDLDGCEVEAVIELKGVHFDFDKATLRPDAIAILNEAAALLSTHERVVVEVAGHTDSVGSDQYNQGLSERRANSVRDYLVSKGITASRMTARGYGEARPVTSNDTKDGRQENRRVELVIMDR
jgi:OOP family OmpA-OmpF porin